MDKLESIATTDHTDKITIGLYGLQIGKTYNPGINVEQQITNIKNIAEKFVAAAVKAKRTPPEIVVSIYLKPDWEHGENHESSSYLEAKAKLLEAFKKELISDDYILKVEDFYEQSNLTESEKDYLDHLESKGSIADMIKTHSIIREENQTRRHLQLDSNTLIPNFEALYNNTFARESAEQRDGLNASYYDTEHHYVSAHNKIVYTTPNGVLAKSLQKTHLEYVDAHKDDHKDSSKSKEKTEKNSIYARDFTVALAEVGLTRVFELTPDEKKPTEKKTVYAATLSRPEYRITGNVITAVNMSWLDKKPPLTETEEEKIEREQLEALEKKLKGLTTTIEIGEDKANAGYPAYVNAVRKYTDEALLDYSQTKPVLQEKPSQELQAMSNHGLEKEMIGKFIDKVKDERPDMLKDVVRAIPLTARGDILVREIAPYIKGMQQITDVQSLRIKVEEITSGSTATQESTMKMTHQ